MASDLGLEENPSRGGYILGPHLAARLSQYECRDGSDDDLTENLMWIFLLLTLRLLPQSSCFDSSFLGQIG